MSSTTIGEHIRLQRSKNRTTHHLDADDDPPLSHVVLPISEPTLFCYSAMSSLFLLPTTSKETTKKKPKCFTQMASFRGMGRTAPAVREVSVPSSIRSSVDWNTRTRKEKKMIKNNKKNKASYDDGSRSFLNEARDIGGRGCVAIPDVWCGPGLGFSTDAVLDPPVLSVPPRRNLPSSLCKIDVDKNNYNHTEGSSLLHRRFLNQESHSNAILNSESTFMTSSRAKPTLFSSEYHGHTRRPYVGDLTEMMMLRNGFVMERVTDSRDYFQDLRLDVDSMSYEQLLELGDRIGYVNAGVKESEIHHCLRKINPSLSHTLVDRKCSICQYEYEGEDEVGKLKCGHNFHVHCLKQWLTRKNACPVCKKTAYVKP